MAKRPTMSMVLILAGCLCISPTLTGRTAAGPEPVKAKAITRAQAPTAEDVRRAEAMANDAARKVAVGDRPVDIHIGVKGMTHNGGLPRTSHSRPDEFETVIVLLVLTGVVVLILATSPSTHTACHSQVYY